MVTVRKTSSEEPEYEEWLGGALVFNVVLNWVGDEIFDLEESLRKDECGEYGSIRFLAEPIQVSGDSKLREINAQGADILRGVHSKYDGDGINAGLAVAINSFEVVHDGDTEAGETVERGEADHFGRDVTECCLAGEPGQSDVAASESVVAEEAILLEFERGSGVSK